MTSGFNSSYFASPHKRKVEWFYTRPLDKLYFDNICLVSLHKICFRTFHYYQIDLSEGRKGWLAYILPQSLPKEAYLYLERAKACFSKRV